MARTLPTPEQLYEMWTNNDALRRVRESPDYSAIARAPGGREKLVEIEHAALGDARELARLVGKEKLDSRALEAVRMVVDEYVGDLLAAIEADATGPQPDGEGPAESVERASGTAPSPPPTREALSEAYGRGEISQDSLPSEMVKRLKGTRD
jgi:hypothetical protein